MFAVAMGQVLFRHVATRHQAQQNTSPAIVYAEGRRKTVTTLSCQTGMLHSVAGLGS